MLATDRISFMTPSNAVPLVLGTVRSTGWEGNVWHVLGS